MTKKITPVLFSIFIVILLPEARLFASNLRISFSGNPTSNYIVPADSPKKAPPPPVTMQTYPVQTSTAKITASGYVQARFQYFQDTLLSSGVDIRNARLILKGTPITHLGYNFQADFAPPTVRVLDASASYTIKPYAKFTFGQQKVPISYESLRTDYDIHSMSRSQVVEALTARSKDVLATANSTTAVNNNGRDIGFLFSGGITNNNTQGTWVDYYLGVFDGSGINMLKDADNHKDIAGRAVVHPIKALSIGGSFLQGKSTYGVDVSEPKVRNRFGFDAAYEDGKRIYAAAEFLQGVDSATTRQGYYALLEGYILPSKFAAEVKYDYYDPNTNKDNDANTIYSFALNWYFAPFTKVQVQYDMKHENASTQKSNDVFSIQAQILF